MERFKAHPGEEILLKGSLFYKTSKWRGVPCQGILTSKRFVMGKKLNQLWSVIPRLYSHIRGKKIVFQIPLENFDSITYNKGTLITLKTTDGAEYQVIPDGLFSKKETWIQAITDAVQAARPEIKVKVNADSVEFSKP